MDKNILYEKIPKAAELALRIHRDDVDKAGVPYVVHLSHVAAGVSPEEPAAIIVAWLHDAVEDHAYPLEEIEKEFGKEVRDALEAISKKEGEEYAAFIERVLKNPLALKVKLADLASNLRPDRGVKIPDRLKDRYLKAKARIEAELELIPLGIV